MLQLLTFLTTLAQGQKHVHKSYYFLWTSSFPLSDPWYATIEPLQQCLQNPSHIKRIGFLGFLDQQILWPFQTPLLIKSPLYTCLFSWGVCWSESYSSLLSGNSSETTPNCSESSFPGSTGLLRDRWHSSKEKSRYIATWQKELRPFARFQPNPTR